MSLFVCCVNLIASPLLLLVIDPSLVIALTVLIHLKRYPRNMDRFLARAEAGTGVKNGGGIPLKCLHVNVKVVL